MNDNRPDWYVRQLRDAAERLRANLAADAAFLAANPPAPYRAGYNRGGHIGGTTAGFQRW